MKREHGWEVNDSIFGLGVGLGLVLSKIGLVSNK